MKKLLFVAMAMLIACSASFAQDAKDIIKERQAISKLAKKELTAKVDKVVKKEAKRLAKEGWVVSPGALPLEKQLERSYTMEYEYDEDQFPKYIMANAQSIAQNYDAAKTTAISLAITNLAGQIQTEVTALVENTVANEQMDAEEKDPNPMAKGMSWIKTNAMLAIDESDHTVADLMTDGCNMGVKSLNRYLNQYEAADEVSKDITKRLIKLEEELTKDIRDFL